ncbi:MAG: 50S ribosomal protein L11 methyltransferase [Anaerovoracaceae bacterium]|nr:50S ribosomal protein L11 methyltransferase [Anaerovoracaceae bacterium]
MNYIEVSVRSNTLSAEDMTGILLVGGVTDCIIEDPGTAADMMKNRREYDWDYVEDGVLTGGPQLPCVKFYAEDSGEGREKVREVLSGFGGTEHDVSMRVADDSEWKDKYKEFFRALDLSDRLVVRPSWDSTPAGPGKKVIELDPGMAFGTGGHATTAMCAELLDEEGCEGKDVLDIGCGSGILSIAAARLGAESVLAVDIDEEAVSAASQNVEKNGLSDVIEVRRGDLAEGTDLTADIIAANLMAELIAGFLPDAAGHLKPGGAFICSGILEEKTDMVKKAAIECGLTIEKEKARGEWRALLGRK